MSLPIITLKEYRKWINDPALDKYEDLPVVYSCDDEGNAFDRVLSAPGLIEIDRVNNDHTATFKKAVCVN